MKGIASFILLLTLCIGALISPTYAGDTDPLFISLTSDDSHRAKMAISFGGNQYNLGHPLTIFLNDRGVRVGSKKNSEKFAEQQKALIELAQNGATVLMCPMCKKHYGVEDADLLPGLQVGRPELTGPALFKENTKTLTW